MTAFVDGGTRGCPSCNRPNSAAAVRCWGCGGPLPGGAIPPGYPPTPPSAVSGRYAPAFPPPGPPPVARRGLSTAAIVGIVLVVVVVATLVPAVVLYYLVSGLTLSGEQPSSISLAPALNSTAGPVGDPASYYVSLTVNPDVPLATSEFALRIANGPLAAPLVGASSTCEQGAGPTETSCLALDAGWYAVLVGASGKVAATYSLSGGTPGWANLPAGASSALVTHATTLLVVSNVSYASYTLWAYGTGSWAVSGAVLL